MYGGRDIWREAGGGLRDRGVGHGLVWTVWVGMGMDRGEEGFLLVEWMGFCVFLCVCLIKVRGKERKEGRARRGG